MAGRSAGLPSGSRSRPHHSPARLPQRTERRIIGRRVRDRLGPARIACRLGLNPSTVHQVLCRYRCPRLACLDRATKVVVRRYERDRPGELVHVDVKKPGNIPDGGGHRFHDKAAGQRHRRATSPIRNPSLGYCYLHTALDDHSRLACTEILADERKDTAAAFLARAHAWYASLGITIERVLSDNGGCYRSRDWPVRHAACRAGVAPKYTRPCRPQTNGKVERYHRTLAGEWAYAQPCTSETQRRATLPNWLHTYNNHREHTALGGHPPAYRVTNLSGQNS